MGLKKYQAPSKENKMLDKFLQWDRAILIYLNRLGFEQYDQFWLAITKFETWAPLFISIIALIFWKYGRKEGFWMLLSYMSMLIMLKTTVLLVKLSFERLRPNNDPAINQLIRVVAHPLDYSFFSGHSAFSMSVAVLAILFLRRKFKWIKLLFIFTFLFSYSRIYLGVHFPSDIIAGWFAGFLFAAVFYKMHQKFITPYIV